jgi:imidazole glycerol-phosphate synthase subunit HisF
MAHGRLIPAMLLSSGRLVKGRRFGNHEDAGNPVTTARIYNDQMADEIVVLDIDATPQGRGPDLDTLAALTQRCFVPIAFGGGIASVETAAAALRAGADKIVINSAAQAKPSFLSELAGQFGSQAVVAAIDVIDTPAGPRVAADQGRKATIRKPAEWAAELAAAGAGEIFLTSVDREGGRGGLDLAMTRMVAEAVPIPVVAHGGVGRLEDFVSAFTEGGASAVAAGRIFQFADNNLIKVRRYMVQSGVELRSA